MRRCYLVRNKGDTFKVFQYNIRNKFLKFFCKHFLSFTHKCRVILHASLLTFHVFFIDNSSLEFLVFENINGRNEKELNLCRDFIVIMGSGINVYAVIISLQFINKTINDLSTNVRKNMFHRYIVKQFENSILIIVTRSFHRLLSQFEPYRTVIEFQVEYYSILIS